MCSDASSKPRSLGMEGGGVWRLEHARADAALTALRAELYATAKGRAEHLRLERRLEALVDGARAVTVRDEQEDPA
ncbi:MAG: hypothetical protein JKY37_10055 [Nannocystaceae bacterium]|nr:hypothetical protein [Nannocystaceae bacterium]